MSNEADLAPLNDTSGPLVIIQGAPYQGYRAQAGLDAALSFAVFGKIPSLLFTGTGVLCLREQIGGSLGRKSIRKLIDSLPMYDIETVYVDEPSLHYWKLNATHLPSFAETVAADDMQSMHKSATSILSY
ncbi:MAG: DsrE family protein [Pseudomonadota bacterium]